MCSIFASFSKERFKELINLNQHRGTFSYSLLILNPNNLEIISLIRDFGLYDPFILDDIPDNMYYLGHCQAPTGGLIKDIKRIHPAQFENSFLFHNGIIKQKDINRLQLELNTDEQWDTMLMLQEISKKGLLTALNDIDGSFACVYGDNTSINIFRSAAGVLFIDEDLTISSTKFENSSRIEKDIIYQLDLNNKKSHQIDNFISKSNPYFY